MNDLDDLVRQELRARVDTAEAKQPEVPPSVLLGRLDQRIRRARFRRRWGAGFGAVAIAAAIALVLGLTSLNTPAPKPDVLRVSPKLLLTDTAATPAGWMPVAFGNAQISVPADWQVDSWRCARLTNGYVMTGTASTPPLPRSPRCRHASNVAIIKVLPAGQGQTHRRSGYINGIPLLGIHPVARGYASFLAPTLHVLISVRGPLGNKVLGTLTRSPLAVVLEAGRHLPVPDSWRWRDFGGIRFTTPGKWRTIKSHVWYPCWSFIESPQAVEMVNATRNVGFSCSPGGPDNSPRHGVVVGAGRYVSPHGPATHECRSLHSLRACFAMPGPGGPLELVVDVPGRPRPTVVEIGLKGNGLEARMIFESIRPR
jgi:hypothetical protein